MELTNDFCMHMAFYSFTVGIIGYFMLFKLNHVIKKIKK